MKHVVMEELQENLNDTKQINVRTILMLQASCTAKSLHAFRLALFHDYHTVCLHGFVDNDATGSVLTEITDHLDANNNMVNKYSGSI